MRQDRPTPIQARHARERAPIGIQIFGFAAVTLVVWIIRAWFVRPDHELPIWMEPILQLIQWVIGTSVADVAYRIWRGRTHRDRPFDSK